MRKLNHRTRLVILTALIFVIIAALYIWGLLIPDDAMNGSYLNAKEPPTFSHPFGTDALGRDLFLRTIKGLSLSITIGLNASLISALVALVVGFGVATGSKMVDSVISWIIDLVMSVPHIILIILISFVLGRGMKGLIVGIAATHWCTLARVIRSEILKLKGQHYVAFARRMGKTSGWIMMNHMLPHLVPQFIVSLVLMFPHAILHEASISFLGFGLSPETATIGIILSESMRYLSTGMWWAAVFPGLTLVVIVLLFERLGNHLVMILDPYSAEK